MAHHQIRPKKRIDDLLMERQRLDQDIKQRYGRTVAILFSDICGYTQYTEQKGDLLSRYMLLRHNQIVFPAIERHQGKVIQVMGDGILAVFTAPISAVAAAVDIHKSLTAMNRESSADEEIHVKIGINIGDVLLDEGTAIQGLTGDAANVAARLQDYAGKDEILISRSVHDKIEKYGQWLCRFHGEVMFKGKSVSTPVYRVIWKEERTGWGATESHGSSDGVPSADVKAAKLTENPIVTLEFSREGSDISISMHEKIQGEESTLRHYETISFRPKSIDAYCKLLVRILNKANRQGQVTGKVLNRLREIGQVLYDELLSFNVKERLNQTKADTLILSIDDRLVHIPWELLFDGRKFFCMRFSMGRVVKTRQTPANISGRPLVAPLNMLVLADPTGDLKNASAEGNQICEFLNQRPMLINAAMPKTSMSAEMLKAKLRNYDMIHFAGHANYNRKNPASGGWRLQDSSLTTDDIARMAGGASMPTMVFANACQSARTGQWLLDDAFEHQIFGLANAFLLAGVKHYIGTFWEIMDEPGRHFAIEFYKQLFSGRSVGRAVLEARRALVSLYGEETIIWASYVFYGDPTFDYAAHIKSRPKSVAEKSAVVTRTRPARGARTREKREATGTSRKANVLRVVLALVAVAILAGAAMWGGEWHRDRSLGKLEQQAYMHCNAGEYEKANRICRQLQQDAPERPASSLILGDINLNRGNLDDARKYFEYAAAKNAPSGETRIKAFLGLGRLSSLESRPEAAVAYYKQAVNLDPANVSALSAQAVLLEQQGKLEEAHSAYSRAASLATGEAGLRVAADQIRDRMEFLRDEARQARIDRLVQDILSADRRVPAESGDEWSSTPLTVWMLNLQTKGLSMQEGKDRLIHGLLVHDLMKYPRIRLVERALLDKLLSELNLGASPLANRDASLSIGRLVSARMLLIGRIVYLKNRMQATVRMVECETGVVRASVTEEFDRQALPQSVARRLSSAIVDAVKMEYPLRAKVTTIGSNVAMIDVGKRQGAHSGMVLKGAGGEVAVRIRFVGDKESKVDITAGKERVQPGFRLEEAGDPGH